MANISAAASQKGHGCLPPIDSIRIYDYSALPKKEMPMGAASVTDYKIPEDRLPQVKDQETVGSCVAHAITSTLEVLHYIETGKWVTLSPGWFYGYARDEWSNGWGMVTSNAVEYTKDFGSVPIEMFAEHTEMPEMKKIAKARPELEEYAKPFKTISFVRINWANKERKWNDVKEAFITYNIPLVIDSRNYFGEGHCIMAYGFVEEKGRKYLYFQNSWGENYGDNGRSKIPFDEVDGIYMLTDETIDIPFDDVPESAWYYKNVLHMYAAGLINGDDQGHFNPDAPITRAEVCAMMDRLMAKIEDKDVQMMRSAYDYVDRKFDNVRR